jgi:hypothetical protein
VKVHDFPPNHVAFMDWSTKVESSICAIPTGFMTKVSFVISYLHENKKVCKTRQNFLVAQR